MIRIASVALPKSPMNLAQGDEVPQIITRITRQRPAEFLTTCAKRLLQQYRHKTDVAVVSANVRFRGKSGPRTKPRAKSASLIGRSGSSTSRLSINAVSMSLAGSCFSSESAPRPFHHGIRRRGGTIFWSALPSIERQDQADMRTHLIHRPARDILPLPGGSRVFSYRV
jgi:hypothetical protein